MHEENFNAFANAVDERLDAIEKRLTLGAQSFVEMREHLAQLRRQMETMQQHMDAHAAISMETRELLELGRSAFKLLGYAGVAARWVGGIAAMVAAVYGAIHAIRGGGWPK